MCNYENENENVKMLEYKNGEKKRVLIFLEFKKF